MGSKVAQSKTLPVQPTEFLFKEGEKILCFHNSVDRLYEGIIQKAEARNQGKNKIYYLISLSGGNKGSWDQWLSENLVFRYDDAGLARKEELFQSHKAKFNKKTSKRTEVESSCSKTDRPSINIDTEEMASVKTINELNRDPKSNEDGSKKEESPTNLAAPSPFTLITQVKYNNLLVKIFSGSTEKNQRQFFFEPLVFVDPKSIVSNSCSHGSLKQDFVRITIQMWNLEIRSKVLERLRSLKSLKNIEIEEEDICVMPFEDVQLVCKTDSLPPFISLTDNHTPYLRSNEDLDFYLLVDESSCANVLAHDIRQNPEFYLINDWQLKLECHGFATESGTTPAGSTISQRPTRAYSISICSKDVATSFPTALSIGSSSVTKSIVKLPPGATVDTNDSASSSGSSTITSSASTFAAKEIERSIFILADIVQQPPYSSQTSNCPASVFEDALDSLLTDQLVTIPCLNNYPSLIKEEPAAGMEISLAALAEAQVSTIQFINLEEEDDQPPPLSAIAIKTTCTPVTSQANITTASSSICPESAVVLPVQMGSITAPPMPTRGIFWQPWSTPETSTTTITSVNDKAETSQIISSIGTESVTVPSASILTTESHVKFMLENNTKDEIVSPVKRSMNAFPQQPNTAPKRHKSGHKESLLLKGGSSDRQVVPSTPTSIMATNQLESGESLSASLPFFDEGKLGSQHQKFQKFAETLMGSYSGPKTRSSFKNFSSEMNEYIRSFAAGSNGEPHLLPGAIAIKIINSITKRVGSVHSVEFWKVKPLIVDVCVCVLNHLYLNHVELAAKEGEDRDRVSANQADAFDLITFFLTDCEAHFADCIDNHSELLLFAAECCILKCYTLNDDGAIVTLESDLIDKKVQCIIKTFFFLKKFHKAMERVKINKKLAEEEQKILGLVCYVKKQLGFSPVYDENKIIGSENEYKVAFEKNRAVFQAALEN